MRFRSIRFRLTLWYTLALAVVLTASGFFWHWYLERTGVRHLDEQMTIVAVDTVSLAASRFDADGLLQPSDGSLCQELEELVHRHNWGELVQLRNRYGALICASQTSQHWDLPELSSAELSEVAEGKVLTKNLSDDGPVRVLVYPAVNDEGYFGMVEVASRENEVREATDNLQFLALTLSPLTLLLIAIGGWFLAGRAINPVVRISRAIQRVSAESLDQRLPVPATDDEVAELARTFNDLLERLQDSFRKIRQFSGDASHELRTPLTILKGETEVNLRWAKTTDEFRHALESNLEEINRMERIIEDLLQLAKSDAGEMQMEIVDLSLSDLILEIYMQGRALAEGRDLEVELKLEVDREIRISGDELRLRQMFLNLIVNAIKYTPDPGQVRICLAMADKYAIVRVVDTGVGMPEEKLPHIFDRFYRVDQARNREVGGAGLGLSIVKWIVDAHDGSIEVESQLGEGSSFTVRLPIAGPQRFR